MNNISNNLESTKVKCFIRVIGLKWRVRFFSFLLLLLPLSTNAADGADAQLGALLSDPNATISSIELSPFRRSRYFVGGFLGLVVPDENRLIDGLNKKSRAAINLGGVSGVDFNARLTFYWEGDFHSFTDENGFTAYEIFTSMASGRVNFLRSRGYVPYLKVAAGVAYASRNLSKQYSSSEISKTVGEDATVVVEFGFGLMYDEPKKWLADGDVRLLFEITSRRDNNDKATPVTYFQETFAKFSVEYLFGSSIFQGQKIIIERDVTSDDGGDGGLFREKRNPVIFPSAAELAALSDTARPNIIFFRQFSSYIVDTQKPKLDVIIEQILENPNLQITITGHADRNNFIYDKIERLRFNRSISAKRAVSVQTYLVQKGIDPEQIILQWRADQQPVINSDTAVNRSLNRRADVLVR